MKFFVDENMNAACIPPLSAMYFDHEFHSAWDEGLSGEKDLDLFRELRRRRFQAIITMDRQQLQDQAERQALADARLHWVGYRAKGIGGLRGLALETATVTAGLAYVLEEWQSEPHQYMLSHIPHDMSQRLKIVPLVLANTRPRMVPRPKTA